VIEVDNEGVERDCGIIPPQFLVIFGLVVVEPFLATSICSSTTRVTWLSGEPWKAQRPSVVAPCCRGAHS
jgi:hypothetical protein